MDKGLPFFWDFENRLLKKDDYDNLIVTKRNDHSNFEDLEGNLRGEILVTKLGDVFKLLNMIKNNRKGLDFLLKNLASIWTF